MRSEFPRWGNERADESLTLSLPELAVHLALCYIGAKTDFPDRREK